MLDDDDRNVLVIGVDCATDPRKVGLAWGLWDGEACEVREMQAAGLEISPATWIVERIRAHRRCRCLLALDAPLGWPAGFGASLAEHNAGQPIHTRPADFFRRATDEFIARSIGRRPLDVGAERIARTALSALQLVAQVSGRLGEDIPLLWGQDAPCGLGAVEVYPAALLKVLKLPSSGYKDDAQLAVREQILAGLTNQIHFAANLSVSLALKDADVLDAVISVAAGADFLAGRSMPPEDLGLAQKEGWIWVRQPS